MSDLGVENPNGVPQNSQRTPGRDMEFYDAINELRMPLAPDGDKWANFQDGDPL